MRQLAHAGRLRLRRHPGRRLADLRLTVDGSKPTSAAGVAHSEIMQDPETIGDSRSVAILVLSSIGIAVAVATAMEEHVAWIASFCGRFGGGCRETASFMLLGIPLWIWGVAYYAALGTAARTAPPAVFPLAMIGMGAEIRLAWILVAAKWICVLCIINAAVVTVLVAVCWNNKRVGPAAGAGVLTLLLSVFLMPLPAAGGAGELADRLDREAAAQVGDETITFLELESPLASSIYRLEQQIYEIKRDRLDDLIDGVLLRKEAEASGITVQQFIAQLMPEAVTVSDEEVEYYYRQNRSRLPDRPDVQATLRLQIREYLEKEKKRQELQTRLKPLREKYGVTIHLKAPPLPLTRVRVNGSPAMGPEDAAVTVVEFSDYLCPACRGAHSTSKKIRKQNAGKIRWVFKDFPLERHPGAREMAQAARCAQEQDRFWDFQDLLFEASGKPDAARLQELAGSIGMNVEEFTACLDSGRYADKVQQDIQDAKDSGVNATPTFIINGRLHPGSLTPEDFQRMIDAALNRQKSSRSWILDNSKP